MRAREALAGRPPLRPADGGAPPHLGSIDIGAEVLIADRVFIGDTYHDYREPGVAVLDQPMADPRPVVVESGAFLGINAVVLPGVRIGANACVGAGTVVTRDVPPHSVAVGNPVRIVRHWDPGSGAWRDGEPAPAPTASR